MKDMQKRTKLFEVRAKENSSDNEKMIVEGYALTFEEETVLYEFEGRQYKEVLDRDCLNETKIENVPLRYNHSDNVLLLATTRNNTLKLTKDDKGLYIEAEIAPTTVGRDVYTLIKRGDVSKMSFAFSIGDDEYDSETNTTRIKKIDTLYDVSVVDVPAYETTSVEARKKALKNMLNIGGIQMTEEERKALEEEIDEKEVEETENEDTDTKEETSTEIEDNSTEESTEETEETSEETEEIANEDESEDETEEETTDEESEDDTKEDSEEKRSKNTETKTNILVEKRNKAEEATNSINENKENNINFRKLGGKNNMENKEIELRNTKKYIDAYAEYVKTGKDEEVRKLLSTNAAEDGTIAIPDFVYDEVKTAWDKNDIMNLVRNASVKGNLKINFEISSSPAEVHAEGGEAVEEEELVEGIVELKPQSIKKWISISDEVMDMRGESFLRYIYDELTYRIVKKATDILVGQIAALPATATATSPSANKVTSAPAAATVANLIANVSDEAADYTIIMNKLTYAKFKEVQYSLGYGVDVFEGVRVRFNNTLPAYDTAEAGDVYAVLGDLNHGAMKNFPNGEDVTIKIDELSRKKEDLIEVLGREYVATGVVADKAFALLVKPEAETENEGI